MFNVSGGRSVACAVSLLEIFHRINSHDPMDILATIAERKITEAMVQGELDYKLLKLNMTRKHPLDLEDFPEYREKITDRLGG